MKTIKIIFIIIIVIITPLLIIAEEADWYFSEELNVYVEFLSNSVQLVFDNGFSIYYEAGAEVADNGEIINLGFFGIPEDYGSLTLAQDTCVKIKNAIVGIVFPQGTVFNLDPEIGVYWTDIHRSYSCQP